MKKPITIIVSLVVAVGLIGGALYVRNQNASSEPSNAEKVTPPPTEAARDSSNNNTQQPNAKQPQAANKTFTATELAKFNGKDGADCYVAVNGTVYHIEQGV